MIATDTSNPGALVVEVVVDKDAPAVAFKLDMTVPSNIPRQAVVPVSMLSLPFSIKAAKVAKAEAADDSAKFQPALRADIKRDAAGLPTSYEFRLNPDMTGEMPGLEKLIMPQGNNLFDLKPKELKLKASP